LNLLTLAMTVAVSFAANPIRSAYYLTSYFKGLYGYKPSHIKLPLVTDLW
ncbi:hypothetical protein MNBD_GAMMA08-2552, partial [hydrothermal vent metagenome]